MTTYFFSVDSNNNIKYVDIDLIKHPIIPLVLSMEETKECLDCSLLMHLYPYWEKVQTSTDDSEIKQAVTKILQSKYGLFSMYTKLIEKSQSDGIKFNNIVNDVDHSLYQANKDEKLQSNLISSYNILQKYKTLTRQNKEYHTRYLLVQKTQKNAKAVMLFVELERNIIVQINYTMSNFPYDDADITEITTELSIDKIRISL